MLGRLPFKELRRLPVAALLLANAVPVVGALTHDWGTSMLVGLYWAETLIMGVYYLLRLPFIARWYALLAIPFFTVHFGLFMAGHGVFLFVLTVALGAPMWPSDPHLSAHLRALLHEAWPSLAGFVVSHGVSFGIGFLLLGRHEWEQMDVQTTMMAPYRRVIVTHVTILVAFFALAAVGPTIAGLLVFVILKTGADLYALVRADRSEHSHTAPRSNP